MNIDPDIRDCTKTSTTPITNGGEFFGINSRIYDSTVYKTGQTSPSETYRCFKTSCTVSNTVQIYIENYVINCTPADYGNDINVSSPTSSAYTGVITCPSLSDIDALCKPLLSSVCPNNCSNNGYCNKGVCTCIPGFTGSDCSAVSCHYSCKTCYDVFSDTCLTCDSTTVVNRIVAPSFNE